MTAVQPVLDLNPGPRAGEKQGRHAWIIARHRPLGNYGCFRNVQYISYRFFGQASTLLGQVALFIVAVY
jgi:hypothetical protein